MPVREAVKRLEFEGVVTIKPRSACRVRVPSRKTILEVYQVREALEGYAVLNGSGRRDPAAIGRLRVIVEKMRLLSTEPSADTREQRAIELDRQFHAEIIGLAGNELLDSHLPSAQRAREHDADAREDLPRAGEPLGGDARGDRRLPGEQSAARRRSCSASSLPRPPTSGRPTGTAPASEPHGLAGARTRAAMAQPNAAEYRGRGTTGLRAVYRASRGASRPALPSSRARDGETARQPLPSGGPGNPASR